MLPHRKDEIMRCVPGALAVLKGDDGTRGAPAFALTRLARFQPGVGAKPLSLDDADIDYDKLADLQRCAREELAELKRLLDEFG